MASLKPERLHTSVTGLKDTAGLGTDSASHAAFMMLACRIAALAAAVNSCIARLQGA